MALLYYVGPVPPRLLITSHFQPHQAFEWT